jgi:type I restriction enzyme M protein
MSESKIQNMGNAGRNGGEYYTPRPLITTIVKAVAPQIGNKIYDGAVGSAGFLCEAFSYLNKKGISTKDTLTLQKKTVYGKEKKSLAYTKTQYRSNMRTEVNRFYRALLPLG